MVLVVGIHGIGQQHTTGPELCPKWEAALSGGLEVAELGHLIDRIQGQVSVVTFGDLFRRDDIWPPNYDLDDLRSRDEKDLIRVTYDEAVKVQPDLGPKPDELGGWHPTTQRMARVLLSSQAFAGFAELSAKTLVTDVKQALAYMDQDDVRDRIHQRVDAKITSATRVLIGHSMGSLIAYQYLAENRAPQVELLVTVGSPLGIPRIIFDRLRPAPVDGRAAWPGGTKRWVNLADERDYVALVKQLAPLFNAREPDGSTVVDVLVDNGENQHDVAPYLNSGTVAKFLAEYLR